MKLDHIYQERTLILAHRGASGHAPQNTLAAFLMAAEMGADGVELDVHLSADGEAVVIHDDTVDATTDGHGRVSRMTMSEIASLDAGSWFDPRFAGQRIPTLAQVFELLGPRLLINVEIKVELGHHPFAHEAEVVRLIEDHHLVDRVVVSSFTPSALRRVRKLNPHIPLALLYDKVQTNLFPRIASLLGTPYDLLHPSFKVVDALYVQHAHAHDRRVNVWTVNREEDMRRMVDAGVDGIITNYPDRLRDILADAG